MERSKPRYSMMFAIILVFFLSGFASLSTGERISNPKESISLDDADPSPFLEPLDPMYDSQNIIIDWELKEIDGITTVSIIGASSKQPVTVSVTLKV